MNDEKKVNKRRTLLRYLALAACILVIAAITVTAIAAANNWFRPEVFIDTDAGNNGDEANAGDKDNTDDKDKDNQNGNQGNQDNNGDDKKPDDGKKPDGDKNDNPASSQTTFMMPVANASVTCEYDFIQNASMCGIWYFHEAVDMAAEAGTDVVSCLDGTVEKVVVDDYLDGTSVTVSHANGVSTVYSFIDVKEGLKAGDKVSRGEVIGKVAQPSGNEYLQGAHLHFAVYENGKSADPADYLDISIK